MSQPFREKVGVLRVPYLRADDPTPEQLRECLARQECWWCGRSGFVVIARHINAAHGIERMELRALAHVIKDAILVDPDYHDFRSSLSKRLTRLAEFRSLRTGHIQLSEAGKDIQRRKLHAWFESIGVDKLARQRSEAGRIGAAKSAARSKVLGNPKARRPHLCRCGEKVLPKSTVRYCSPECRVESIRRRNLRSRDEHGRLVSGGVRDA